jgi:phage baseplate assembly protein W
MIDKVKQINPLDLRDSVGIGVDLPFAGRAVFNTTYTSKDAIKANLINYFLTNKGERYLNPTFGSNIRELLFENINIDTLNSIKNTIGEEIKNFFPRIVINKFEISSNPDAYSIQVLLRYSITNSDINDELIINIEQ